jgi:hypothetical protein
VTSCGTPIGWNLANWLGCPLFSEQLLKTFFYEAATCQVRCVK